MFETNSKKELEYLMNLIERGKQGKWVELSAVEVLERLARIAAQKKGITLSPPKTHQTGP